MAISLVRRPTNSSDEGPPTPRHRLRCQECDGPIVDVGMAIIHAWVAISDPFEIFGFGVVHKLHCDPIPPRGTREATWELAEFLDRPAAVRALARFLKRHRHTDGSWAILVAVLAGAGGRPRPGFRALGRSSRAVGSRTIRHVA